MRLALLFLLVLSSICWSQESANTAFQVHITPRYQHQNLSLQDTVFQAPLDDISIESLRFYISNINYYYKSKKVWEASQTHFLIDATDSTSFALNLTIPKNTEVDELRFLLGVDSLTSTSGVFGGDLDPTNGMYWAWHSGYINFKVEGKSSRCPTRDHGYQFHLGGYASPFANAQPISLTINSLDNLNIVFDISNFFDQIDLSNKHTIMSPSSQAVEFSKLISQSFYVDE